MKIYCLFLKLGERKKTKIKREQILNFICENWYNENRIKTDIIIIKAFLVCGITPNMDGSEDDLFLGFQKLNEQEIVVDDFSLEDRNDENNSIKIEESEDSDMGSSDLEIENDSEK